jgi:subtilisin family serine protease
MNICKRTLLIFGLLIFISACGGTTNTMPHSPSTPTNQTPGQYDYTLGQPSDMSSWDALAPVSLPYDTPYGARYSSLGQAHQDLNAGANPIATVDTQAHLAWLDGWTGKGVKVGIADSFDNNQTLDTHGDWVSIVISSVAPEAKMSLQHVLTGDVADIDNAFNYFETNGYHIINNSWGMDKAERNAAGVYTGSLVAGFDDMIQEAVAAYDPNELNDAVGLYIYAAGNGAEYCDSQRIEDCNYLAGVTDGIRNSGYEDYGDRLIFVGALADNSDLMASYSYQAGNLKYDFIVAHDDVLTLGDAAGTSFAAPRVTGAAALVKHKFPNLTSAHLKQVLLQTATDIGVAGVDEVYGYGKLNIAGALSPIGTVTPK